MKRLSEKVKRITTAVLSYFFLFFIKSESNPHMHINYPDIRTRIQCDYSPSVFPA